MSQRKAGEPTTVTLVSESGETFQVPVDVCKISEFVKPMLPDEGENMQDMEPIPLPNVRTEVLQKVIEFCTHYRDDPMKTIEKPLKSCIMEELVGPWYADFVKNLEEEMLHQLIMAANFMSIEPLTSLTCAYLASLLEGKNPEEVREEYNIKNEFEEE